MGDSPRASTQTSAGGASGAEWRAPRDRLIKDECEQCGSTEPPFTLHHLAPIRDTLSIPKLLREQHRQAALIAFNAGNPAPNATEERQACPRCQSPSLYSRKRLTPKWKCNGQRRGCACGQPDHDDRYPTCFACTDQGSLAFFAMAPLAIAINETGQPA